MIVPLLACALAAAFAGLFAATEIGRRIPTRTIGWTLAIGPAIAFAVLLAQASAIIAGDTVTWAIAWMPTFGIRAAFTLDGLSALFALLVTGIGALVVVYAGYYFSELVCEIAIDRFCQRV